MSANNISAVIVTNVTKQPGWWPDFVSKLTSYETEWGSPVLSAKAREFSHFSNVDVCAQEATAVVYVRLQDARKHLGVIQALNGKMFNGAPLQVRVAKFQPNPEGIDNYREHHEYQHVYVNRPSTHKLNLTVICEPRHPYRPPPIQPDITRQPDRDAQIPAAKQTIHIAPEPTEPEPSEMAIAVKEM